MKAGSIVRWAPPPINGRVVERRIDPASDQLEVLVEWLEDGAMVRRWFDADQLTEVFNEQ